MPDMRAATQAYMASSSHRDRREQEADIFLCATGALRSAKDGDAITRARAVSDNRRLWVAVMDLVRDPNNTLAVDLRASILSVGWAVQREMQRDDPDLGFLIAVNDNIVAGLLSRG